MCVISRVLFVIGIPAEHCVIDRWSIILSGVRNILMVLNLISGFSEVKFCAEQ